ncbi:MAG: hypothetical protein ACJ71O_01805, partial [Nitrososphaeraceae archaeon]
KITNRGIKPWHMYIQVRSRVPIAAANVCDHTMSHNGKNISVDFNYESRSDIAVPKLTIGSTHQ